MTAGRQGGTNLNVKMHDHHSVMYPDSLDRYSISDPESARWHAPVPPDDEPSWRG
jgi:hypothetical protein